jgi:hypothetical protein
MTRPYFSSDVMSLADGRAEISAMRNGIGPMTTAGLRAPTRIPRTALLCQWIRLYNCLVLSSLAHTCGDAASNKKAMRHPQMREGERLKKAAGNFFAMLSRSCFIHANINI